MSNNNSYSMISFIRKFNILSVGSVSVQRSCLCHDQKIRLGSFPICQSKIPTPSLPSLCSMIINCICERIVKTQKIVNENLHSGKRKQKKQR